MLGLTENSPVPCTLPDGRTVLGIHPAETETIWSEINDDVDSPYRRAAQGLTESEAIIDVGAHIGLASISFAEQVPGARLFAFEPAPKTFACLEANLGTYAPGAVALRKAVGSEPGTAQLTFHPFIASASTLYADRDDDERNMEAYFANNAVDEAGKEMAWSAFDVKETVPVEVTTLSVVLKEHGIARVGLLKIDVERAELEVLRGIDDASWPRIRRVVLEVHDIDGRLGETVALLVRRGYRTAVSQTPAFAGGSVYLVLASRD
ncbi:FkbM family methyltransferase [Streptomyces sp. NPDC020801]|uniref:FkbM family methyltransferase n=1 Tax=unclassified Streptomyces TaxID=2593676 RepID=UPI0037AF964F